MEPRQNVENKEERDRSTLRLTENGFWSRYFAALRREIQQLIFHDEDTEEGQHPLANGDGSESGG